MKRHVFLRLFSSRTWQIGLLIGAILTSASGCGSGKSNTSPDPETPAILTREILDASLAAGRRFLLLNQTNEGNFNYEYDFRTQKLTREDSQVRQAGATWGVATIHRDRPSDETHAALAHAIQFFKDNSVRTDDGRRYVIYPGDRQGRTGTIALLSLALTDFIPTLPDGPERKEMAALLNEYMRFLLSLRHHSGEHKEKIIESGEKMYHRHVTEARRIDPDSNATKGFYQWSTMAFYEIHTAGWSNSDRFAHRAIELANWMIEEHRTLRRTKNTAYAHEGLCSAWELARLLGQEKAKAKIGRAVDLGLRKLTSWQVGGPIPNRYLREHPTDDPLAVGGVMNSMADPKLRIDVAQHQMHAVILARRYIYKEAGGSAKKPPTSDPSAQQPAVDELLHWNFVGEPLEIDTELAKAAMKVVWAALQLDVRIALKLPEKLRRDTDIRIVFLSVGGGTRPATVVVGQGRGLAKALEDAITQARHLLPNHNDRRLVRLDVVQEVGLRELVHPRGTLRLTPGKDGFVLIGKMPAALQPAEIVSQGLTDERNRLRLENIILYLGGYDGTRGGVAGNIKTPRLIRPFRTAAYFFDGETFRHLYRGHRIPGAITQESLLESLELAGKYLVGSVGHDGRMVYTYNPATAEQPDDYNILRHAGTAYSMFDLYMTTKNAELLSAAQRARGYLLKQVEPWTKDGADAAVVAFGKKIKLGGAALAVIMLAKEIEATGNKEHLPVAQKLARYIELQQRADGSFISSRNRSDGSERDFVSVYYPGEALLALVRMYSVDKNTRWLDVAERGAHYLIEDRDKNKPIAKLPHDHWLLYALNELHRSRPKAIYLEHSRRIVASMREGQRRKTWPPDYLGSFYTPPRTTPTATRAEGLLAAYKMFEDYGSDDEAERTLQMIHLAVAFELQTQFLAESAMLLDRPQRALGAFHRGLTHFEIRNDYVQHNISALLELYRLMKRKEIEQFGEAEWESTKLINKAREAMRRSTDSPPPSAKK